MSGRTGGRREQNESLTLAGIWPEIERRLPGADLGGELRGLKPPPSTKTLNSKYHTFLLTLKETVENQPHLQVKLRYLHPFTALHQALQFNTCLVLFSDSSSYVRRPFWFCPVYSIKRPLFLVV